MEKNELEIMSMSEEYDKGYDDGFADGANTFEDKLLAEAIANYMVVKGCAATTSGNRIFEFKDVAEHFHITEERLADLREDIESNLADCPQVMDSDGVWIEDDAFNLMFYGNYCNVDMED